jgi:hypothetical protein
MTWKRQVPIQSLDRLAAAEEAVHRTGPSRPAQGRSYAEPMAMADSSAGQSQLSFIKNYAVSVQRVADGPDGARLVGQVFGGISGGQIILGNFKSGRLEVGQEIIARMAIEYEVVGFRTVVTEVLDGTIRLYLLAPPSRVEVINLRKSDRLPLFVPVDIHLRFGGQKAEDFRMVQGVVINLSRGGCSVTTKNPLELNMEVSLHFTLPGARQVFKVDGRVVRLRQKDQIFAQGVQFQRETENLAGLMEVSQWITQNLAYSRE